MVRVITISYLNRPLSAWVGHQQSRASRGRFLRHHLDQLVCMAEPVFSFEREADVFGRRPLHEVPVGIYTVHLGEGELGELAVTPTMITLDGVLLLQRPDVTKTHVPPEHLASLSIVSSTSGRKVCVYSSMTDETTYLHDAQYLILLEHQSPPATHAGHPYRGNLNITTGEVCPE